MEQKNGVLSDKERITDALTSQKYVTSTYNTFVNETATPELTNVLLTILNEEHRIQHEVFEEMSTRGWYPLEKAEEQKVEQEKQKFSSFCAHCTQG